jgi:hypothetical protein
MTKLKVAFRNFTNAPKNLISINFSLRWRRRTKLCEPPSPPDECPRSKDLNVPQYYDRKKLPSCLFMKFLLHLLFSGQQNNVRLRVPFPIAWTRSKTTVRRFSYESSRLHAPANNSPIPRPYFPLQHSLHVFLPQFKFVCQYSAASELFPQIFATTYYFPCHYHFIFPV